MDILDIKVALKKALARSVASNQGSENEGKILGVGSDGTVAPLTYTPDDFVAANQGASNEGKIMAVSGTGEVIPVTSAEAAVATAGDVTYSDESTYSSGTVGAEVAQLKSGFNALGLSVVNGKLCQTYTA